MNIVFSGPSGAGKGSIIKKIHEMSGLTKSVSYTTREQREGEVPGWDYNYIDLETFMELKRKGFFFEITEYGGNFYGISKKNISLVSDDKITMFDLVPTSGLNLKNHFENTCLIYIVPPDFATLTFRRGDRGDHRLIRDMEQMKFAAKAYDYIVINDDLDNAVNQVYSIIDVFKRNSISNNLLFLKNFFSLEEKPKVKKRIK